MSGKRPDIDVFTSLKAKELKFGKVPKARVWFEGNPGEESSSHVERENLPEEVEPDVTYRNVKVDWTVLSRLVHPTDPDQIEAERDEES